MIHMLHQAQLVSICWSVIYKCGYEVPCTPKEAIELDKKNSSTNWQDSMALELLHLDEYETFRDLGRDGKAPAGYKHICFHSVFDVKYDGRHKSCLVAGGHLIDVLLESVYSGVVSL